MKKFYTEQEFVWVKPEKKKGKVQKIKPDTKEVEVTVFNNEGVLEQKTYKLWDIDKLRRPLQIKIKYFDDELIKLEKINIGDWIDLRAAEDILLKQFEFKLIPLGVAMQLPKGFEANIVPRSSTFKKFGIIQTNHFGVVDQSYCGDNDQLFFPALAMRDTEIKKNDRICQFRINRVMPKTQFIEVEVLKNEDRGGHGSTGRN